MFTSKKSLGQNFLNSKTVLRQIADAAQLTKDDVVLEVGPGKGSLTEILLERAASAPAFAKATAGKKATASQGKIIAVEKDDRLIDFLRQKFAEQISAGHLELIHADILDFEFCHYRKSENPDSPLEGSTRKSASGRDVKSEFKFTSSVLEDSATSFKGGTYKIVANIPYYITGKFLRKFLSETDNQPSLMVLLLQKEVVQRIVANDKKESLLSLSVKAYGEPKNLGKVSKKLFSPAPKVDSAILLIDNISKNFFTGINSQHTNKLENVGMLSGEKFSEKKFFEILKIGFGQKRKMLLGNLKKIFDAEILKKAFSSCHLSEKIRAEDLSLGEWKRLIIEISKTEI